MSYDYEGPQASTRLAVEFLTVWMEQNRQAAVEHIVSVLDSEGGPERDFAIAGLLNLGHFLVIQVAKANGAVGAEELTEAAHEYLAYLSVHLPDEP
ncbi:hypothetical protein ACIQI8_27295 [Streptomyces sp. NPDC092369]|uniref:hypothetical protein n=1 Tax=Streptomyces sp. NPDC092369 TaxID=3366015 RepID=UPI0037FC76B5